MEITEVPLELLREAPWNPNEADEATLRRLAASIGRFGTVLPLVVRPLDDAYEVLGGNQRLRIYREQGVATVPCVEVQADDAQARLLAQALNAVHGTDNLNRKAALIRDLLAAMPEADVLAILPDTADALRGLAALGQQTAASLGEQLTDWARVQEAKVAAALHVTSFSLSDPEKEVVERAVDLAMPRFANAEAPNKRGLALASICDEWAAGKGYRPERHRGGHLRVVSASVTQPKEGD